jgi:tetratricopeptide (TPR) repeat protein
MLEESFDIGNIEGGLSEKVELCVRRGRKAVGLLEYGRAAQESINSKGGLFIRGEVAMNNKLNNSIRVILIIVFSMLSSCATTPKGQQRSSESYLDQGYYFASKGQYDQAISDYTKALEINPRYIEAYNNRGLAYASKGQYDEAISDYNKALKINPRYIEAYNNRGNAYLNKGQYDDAISDYNKILKIESRYAVAYYNRGVAYNAKDQYDQAISDFGKALEIMPGFGAAYGNRARAYYLKKNYDKSWDDVKKAQELGYQVPPEFIDDLRKASGRQE